MADPGSSTSSPGATPATQPAAGATTAAGAPATGGTAPSFASIEQIFQMFSPSDLLGTQLPNLGGPLDKLNNMYAQLVSILENDGRGVLTIADIVTAINSLATQPVAPTAGGGTPSPPFKIYDHFSIWTMGGKPALGNGAAASPDPRAYASSLSSGSTVVASLAQIIGADFVAKTDPKAPMPVMSVICSYSPFFSPASRNTKRVSTFLNAMPSTVLSQLVPFMQAEFQFSRSPSNQLQSPSQLKLLMGAADITQTLFGTANSAMAQAHQFGASSTAQPGTDPAPSALDYVGMELFTSPITLTNPQPNLSSNGGLRYVDVLDPYRPFASLEHVTVSSVPSGAGFYCYKKANMSIKVHDRSRLNEIADLLRPWLYTGVTIWLTYGWRAPTRPTGGSASINPYFEYINNNMMIREAYHVMNSSFTLDHIGQTVINLELYTKGVAELRDLKISDQNGDMAYRTKQLQYLIDDISRLRQALKLDPPEGLNKEIRVYQLLDAAESGQAPDFSGASTVIANLQSALQTTHPGDSSADALIKDLKTLYAPAKTPASKFNSIAGMEARLTQIVASLIKELHLVDNDPFLPTATGAANDQSTLAQLCDKAKLNGSKEGIVSFGKLFCTVALRNCASLPSVTDEVQIFFYNLNEHCGPLSCHNISSFPIDVHDFTEALKDEIKSKGSESIKLEDFLSLVINSQFLDKRSIGYGLRQFYDVVPGSKPIEYTVNKEGDFDKKLTQYSNTYGPFALPAVEVYVEMSHKKTNTAGECDIMQLVNFPGPSNPGITIGDSQKNASTKIMRIHIYDKQTNTNAMATQLLKASTSSGQVSGFLEANPGLDDYQKAHSAGTNLSMTAAALNKLVPGLSLNVDDKQKVTLTNISNFTSNQMVKDTVSQLVPSIRFGANGTTITQANLTSKAEPLLSTVQMQRNQTVKNDTQPNGSGPLGIPGRVIPAQLTMTTLGNPLATMAQQFFIDFQTGTTLDNMYITTALTHNFTPGKFETSWTFGFCDGYTVFEGAPNMLARLTSIPAAPAPANPGAPAGAGAQASSSNAAPAPPSAPTGQSGTSATTPPGQ